MRINKTLSIFAASFVALVGAVGAQTYTSVQVSGPFTPAFKAPLNGGPDTLLASGVQRCRTDVSVDNRNRILWTSVWYSNPRCDVTIQDNSLNVSTTTQVNSPFCGSLIFPFLVATDTGGAFAYVRSDQPTTIYHTQNSGVSWTPIQLPSDPTYSVNPGIINGINYGSEFRNKQLVADPNGNIYAIYLAHQPTGTINYWRLFLFKITPQGGTSVYPLATLNKNLGAPPYIRAESTDSHLVISFSPGRVYNGGFINFPGFISIPWSAQNPTTAIAFDLLGESAPFGSPGYLGIASRPVYLTTDGGVLYMAHRNGDTGLTVGGDWQHKFAVKKLTLDATGHISVAGPPDPAGYRLVDLGAVAGIDITNHMAMRNFVNGGPFDQPFIDFAAARMYPPSYGTGGASAYIYAQDGSGTLSPDYANFSVVRTNGARTTSSLVVKNDVIPSQLPAGWTQTFVEGWAWANSLNGVRGGIVSTFRRMVSSGGPGTSDYCLEDFSM